MFTRLAQITAFALAVAIGASANAAPLAYGTYYDETAGRDCLGATACTVYFSQLPSDKLVMIRKINCAVSSYKPLAQAFFQISATFGGSALATRYLPIALPAPQVRSDTINYTNWETDTHYLVGSGRFPQIVVLATETGGFTMKCTIIGDLVTPIL